MSKQSTIKEIESLQGVKGLVTAYQEIAANRMRRTRSSVLQKRDFLTEISEIFQEVKRSYYIKKLHPSDLDAEKKSVRVGKHNGKTVCILLSANTGLYGDIITETYRMFTEAITKDTCDIVIIGKVGKRRFSDQYPNIPFTYYDLTDGEVDMMKLPEIITFISQYEKILVFHGKFRNVISQQPTVFDVSGSIPEEENKELMDEKTQLKYFFEPSVEQILQFFEEQIVAAIFEQTIHESSLSKFASRMVTLDRAVENIRQQIKKVDQQKRLEAHQAINKKQINSLVSISLWG